jgi:8-oxo-dGTP pyrophosphatase MutT (NUDIX family)
MPMDHAKNPWQIREEKLVYNNPWILVREFDVIHPSGRPGIYGTVHFKNRAIGIITLDENNLIHLVGQFRFPLNQYSWEIPEGGGPLDEEPLEAAKRELREETGLVAQHWMQLLTMHLSNSVSDEEAIIFLARELRQERAEPEDTELLAHQKLNIDEAYHWVISGKISDAIAVAGILALKVMLIENKINLQPISEI